MTGFKGLTQEALTLGNDYNQAKATAQRPNPDLTPQAQERATTAALERLGQQFRPQFDVLRSRIDLERDAALEQAARVRPTLDPTDTAALVRTEQAWTHNVRPLLERGQSLAEALAGADLDGVLGAERFASSWLAQHAPEATRLYDGQDVVAVTRQAVSAALAGLQSDPEKGRAILAGDSAAQDHQNAVAVLAQAREGRTLEASLLAHYSGETQ